MKFTREEKIKKSTKCPKKQQNIYKSLGNNLFE